MGTCGCIDGVKKELGKVTDALGKATVVIPAVFHNYLRLAVLSLLGEE
jgi:hypothetical protein